MLVNVHILYLFSHYVSFALLIIDFIVIFLVEEPGNYRFCEIEKTSFEVSKFLQRKTPVVNDGFLRNLLHSICVNSKMQLLSQNFQIWSKYRKIKYLLFRLNTRYKAL